VSVASINNKDGVACYKTNFVERNNHHAQSNANQDILSHTMILLVLYYKRIF
jgi:hypothetical protein